MKTIEFLEANIKIGFPNNRDPKKNNTLRVETKKVDVVTCWKMSFRERIKAFFTGRVWLVVRSNGGANVSAVAIINKLDAIKATTTI